MTAPMQERVRRSGLLGVLLVTPLFACSCERETEAEAVATTSPIVWHQPLRVGVRCQQEYQDDWQNPLSHVWQTCWEFGDQMSKDNYWSYYYNLHGAAPVLHAKGDGSGVAAGGADAVDFLFLFTHGLINPYRNNLAEYDMWDKYSVAHVDEMRLGDSDVGASVLATYSCDTMRIDGGDVYRRWYPAFAGGLRVALGAHHAFYDVPNVGRSFASRIQDGGHLATAWSQSTLAASSENHPMTITTGRDPEDCWNRHGATIVNVTNLDRLRDERIGYMCWSYWN